jgi:hypothetical protein
MKILFDPMQVREVMKRILAPDPSYREREAAEGFVGMFNQTQAARVLGVTQSKISDWKRATPEIENAWQAFMRLFTYCEQELGFDPRTPSDSPKKEGKGMNIVLAEQAKGKKRKRR